MLLEKGQSGRSDLVVTCIEVIVVVQKGGLMRNPREKGQVKKFRKVSKKGWRRTRRGPRDGRQRGTEFGQVDLLGRVRTKKTPLDCGAQKA